MRQLLIFMFILTLPILTLAQTNVSGVVKSESGEPLPGVNIVISGTTIGTITDANGNFSISVPDINEAKLSFSFIGFQQQTIELEGQTKLNIVLNESYQDLDEVVVIGYGEIAKRDLTGSVTQVSESENIARQYNTVDALLQGRAAGVQVTSNPGSPNGAVSVRIRGTNSLRGNNEPLYVIDGVIINTAGEDVLDASTDSNELQTDQNGLTGLNPRDIESIEILKDASATAIYGSRGANGVVLITTKKGTNENGKARINFYATTDFSKILKKVDVMDAITYANYMNENDVLNGTDPRYQIDGTQIYSMTYTDDGQGGTIGTPGLTSLEQIDWQNEIYQLAVSHSEGITVSGNSEKTNYYFSAGYNNINGIVETTSMKSGDIRLNLTTDLTPKLKMDNRVSAMYQKGTFAQAGSKSGGNRSFTKQVLTYRPLIGLNQNEDDTDLEISNPFGFLEDFDDITEENRITISSSLEYDLLKGLKYKISGGVDYRTKDRQRWYGLQIFQGEKDNGVANYSNLRRYSYTIDNILTYNTKIANGHRLNATAAATYDAVNLKNSIYEITDFPVKTLRSEAPQLGQIVTQPYAMVYADEAIFSLLGRINYTVEDKYIFTASFRADQSSKFASGNKWGYFPSLAVAWRLGEERFIKDLGWVHNLKLRVGWGQTGNQAINPYQTLSTYNTVYYVDASGNTIIGNAPARIANADLTWEKTEQYNAGIDISLLKGRINASFDTYYKNTKDLLQDISLPTSSGFSSMTINRGKIENKGIEISLDGLIVKKNDFTVSAGGHFSVNRNKVLELGLTPSTVWINGQESAEVYYLGNNVSTGTYFKAPANIFMEGQPIGMFWGYQTNGVYQDQEAADAGPTYFGTPNQAGDLIFVDQSGDGNIGIEDRTFIGNPNPDFTYGFDFTVTWKNFTLKALFDGVHGNDVANGYNLELAFVDGQTKNALTEAYVNAWRTDQPNNTHPRIGFTMMNQGFPDVIVEDGSFLRLNNVTLGYDIPFENSSLSNINLYVSGQNLLYFTNYSGYNPQVTSFLYDGTIMGVDWVGTPNVRTVLLGINVTF